MTVHTDNGYSSNGDFSVCISINDTVAEFMNGKVICRAVKGNPSCVDGSMTCICQGRSGDRPRSMCEWAPAGDARNPLPLRPPAGQATGEFDGGPWAMGWYEFPNRSVGMKDGFIEVETVICRAPDSKHRREGVVCVSSLSHHTKSVCCLFWLSHLRPVVMTTTD